MYQCFHCGCYAVIWQADFTGDEYGYDDENGIVHVLKCANCGADITYYIPSDEKGESDERMDTGF